MGRRRPRHHDGYGDDENATDIESFYDLSGEKIYISTGNLGQKLQAGSYAMKYCRNRGEVYLKPAEVADIDDTTTTKQMKEIMGICTKFIAGVDSKSIEKLGYKTKFGLLLKGPPGTGKSQTTNVAAATFIKHGGIVINIADEEVLDEGAGDYIKRINTIQPDLSILLLLEDLDGYPDYIERSLTSILDGEQSPQNILFMGTTNFCDNISERLLRPGRFDIIYTVEGMSASVRRTYITSKLKAFSKKTSVTQMKEYMLVTKDYNFAELRTFMAYIGIFGFDARQIASKLSRTEV